MDRQADIQTVGLTDRQTNRQAGRHTDRPTDRQPTDRLTDGHADRYKIPNSIPPSIFTLFLVTSLRNGFTKAYAIGNILGAAR